MKRIAIVWVYGSSGAGKETFIKRINSKAVPKVIEKLNWKDKKIKVIWESLKYIAQSDNDKITNKRKEIIKKVSEAIKERAEVILIKGQDVDLEKKLPQTLKNKFPSQTHQIIFLHADLRTLLQRWKKKIWFNKKYKEDDVEEWLRHQLKFLSKLKGFEVIALTSKNDSYRRIKFPQKI